MDIFISDLDGTLLQKNAQLSPNTKKILIQLLNEGLPFTVASARSVKSIQTIMKDIPISLPIIEFNGAFLSDIKTGEHLFIHNISPNLLDEIYSLGQKFESLPFISTFNGKKDCLYYQDIHNEGMDFYFQERVRMKDDRLQHAVILKEAFRDQVVCFTFINQKEKLQELYAEIEGKIGGHVELHLFEELYKPGWYWLTVHDKKATKDQAIQTLKKYINLPNAKVTVFGDGVNDTKMFHAADYSVAVDNACAECKYSANEVIGNHCEDSVAFYLKRVWQQK
ncbi:Cof-type HAD-IIB family hydrolase [Bacillus salitolerans]|uniref:Cof-type HAD-IIB family hydrolase n=1 Tax=Bacillus salitolerans TaxID=1437434 RepID=A0ABW4LV88_9BACI